MTTKNLSLRTQTTTTHSTIDPSLAYERPFVCLKQKRKKEETKRKIRETKNFEK
jgi:hypothetical protein